MTLLAGLCGSDRRGGNAGGVTGLWRTRRGGAGRGGHGPHSTFAQGEAVQVECLKLGTRVEGAWFQPHVSNGLPLELLDLENARLRDPTV